MNWRGRLDRLTKDRWRRWAVEKCLKLAEFLSLDSELILDVQADSYRKTAKKFRRDSQGNATWRRENELIADLYDCVAEQLEHAAFNVYASFK